MFQMKNLDHIALYVTNLARSVAWYQNILGMEKRFQYQDQTGLGNPIGLGQGQGSIVLFPSPPDPPMIPLQGHIAFTLSRDNFTLAQQHIRQQGVPFDVVAYKTSIAIYFLDPDGYQIELNTYEL
jgi:catechol 2,3-dioxygenase-like lactoylglutathione lyase family enzyme